MVDRLCAIDRLCTIGAIAFRSTIDTDTRAFARNRLHQGDNLRSLHHEDSRSFLFSGWHRAAHFASNFVAGLFADLAIRLLTFRQTLFDPLFALDLFAVIFLCVLFHCVLFLCVLSRCVIFHFVMWFREILFTILIRGVFFNFAHFRIANLFLVLADVLALLLARLDTVLLSRFLALSHTFFAGILFLDSGVARLLARFDAVLLSWFLALLHAFRAGILLQLSAFAHLLALLGAVLLSWSYALFHAFLAKMLLDSMRFLDWSMLALSLANGFFVLGSLCAHKLAASRLLRGRRRGFRFATLAVAEAQITNLETLG